VREANRRLAQNPRDAEALHVLASAAFEEQDFPRAFQHYQALLPQVSGHLRYAQAARNSGKTEEAYQGFLLAHDLDRESFEVSYNLGLLEYKEAPPSCWPSGPSAPSTPTCWPRCAPPNGRSRCCSASCARGVRWAS